MSYFAPYLDETGLHIPTYSDRMASLLDAYRSIFGPDVNLTESSPDYQLLSIFARALDDFSAVLVSLFASRNPGYAAGAALDLSACLALLQYFYLNPLGLFPEGTDIFRNYEFQSFIGNIDFISEYLSLMVPLLFGAWLTERRSRPAAS